MRMLVRFRDLAIAAALLAAPTACTNNDPGREADRAADRLNSKAEDLQDESKDLAEKARSRSTAPADAKATVKKLARETTDVGDRANDVARATDAFERTRRTRVETLRAAHAVIASQSPLIATLAQAFPLVEGDRGKVAEKLQIFQMRIDEAGNAIQTLQATDAATWKDRDDEASRAMSRLDEARTDAWDALADAKRLDRTSMR